MEIIKLKEEAKQEATLFMINRSREIIELEGESKSFIGEYSFYMHIRGFTELEEKLKTIIDTNKTLIYENNLLNQNLNNLKIKYKELMSTKKDDIKKLQIEMISLLYEKNKDEKSMTDFYQYVFYKRRKNRSNREICLKHLKNCEICKKDINKKKFFSFEITPLLIEILKEKGFEDYIIFEEKECCLEMSRKILKAITYLSHEYQSKSSLWYRNFLVKKNSLKMRKDIYQVN